MRNVLVVEDDENKRSQVLTFLCERFPAFQTITASSLQTGLRAVKSGTTDLVILDMTLPNYDQGPEEDGGTIHPLGGQEFLRKMKRARVVVPVIVLTQFETFGTGSDRLDLETLRISLREKYAEQCIDTIFYSSAVDTWKRQLQQAIELVMERDLR